jgi:hypothetical protein
MSEIKSVLVAGVLVAATLAAWAEESGPERHPGRMPKTERGEVGKHKDVPKPKHMAAGPNDHPVIHELYDFYQEDQRFADLFGKGGSSMICGPTSLANVLAFLRYKHDPKYSKILEKSVGDKAGETALVDACFKLCHTSKDNGTTCDGEIAGARAALEEGGYPVKDVFWIGVHGGEGANNHAPRPLDVRKISQEGKLAVLCWGWYDIEWDGKTHEWKYKRLGGHVTALAGYDSVDPLVIYITNPMVNYQGQKHFSKVYLWPCPTDPGVIVPPVKQIEQSGETITGFESEDVGSGLHVLEDMLVISPK